MNHQKWYIYSHFQFSHKVHYEWQDAGNGTDGLFIASTWQILRETKGKEASKKKKKKTIKREEEEHFSFFFNYTLTRRDTGWNVGVDSQSSRS